MLKTPRLKYCYHAEFLDDTHVLLSSEKNSIVLSGAQCCQVLAEIHDSGLTVETLLERLQGKMSAIEVYYTLKLLEKKGYLTEAAPSLPPEACAYWNAQGIDAPALLQVLQSKTVTFESLGSLPDDAFLEAFDSLGLRVGQPSALHIVISDNYQRAELRSINQEALAAHQPWLLVKPTGIEVWLGPLFVLGRTGCWECLRQRLEMNRPMNAFYQNRRHTDEPLHVPAAHNSLSLQIAANQTALEAVKWLYFEKHEGLEGRLVTLDAHSLERRSHRVVKRPQCPACGEPEIYREPQAVAFTQRSSFCATAFGGYRETSPEETVERYRHHVSPITGVVQTLHPYFSTKGAPVYNYSSGRNVAFQSKTLLDLNDHVRSGNGGKGRNFAQAKAGALCEAIERYSGTYQGGEASLCSSLTHLGRDGIHPNACMNYSQQQYRNRDALNRKCSKFYALVPAPFDESLEMEWTPVYSLSEQRFKYLPSCFCYAQFPVRDEYQRFAYPDSNGGAAGNSLEEAVLQGFLELVERDSVALWWYNMLRKPELDLSSFNEPYFLQLLRYYHSLHRRIHVLDLTTDLGIPAFGAISSRADGGKQDILFGFGAHVDAKIAVERALIELNQLLPIADVPERDRMQGNYRTRDANFLEWLNAATLENQSYLLPQENTPKKTASDYPQLCEPSVYDSLMCCLEIAARHGLETLVLDMTRPDIGLPVAKVFVPGLRHFWQRLAPGRLYDTPVEMGWVKAPLTEDALNPIALFI